MLRAYYHCKEDKKATYSIIYEDGTTINQIKVDMRCNNAVLDAIHNSENNQVTLYSRRLTKSDVYYSLPFFEYLAKKEVDNV